ncbi:bromodomain-containing protein DDB_G0270170-like [Saccostrea cucullata]|uniref:bromodomain-containing protein DDB_G0270170-like n=1 Tax=Saccostrea cuccullata TaxID=36930 RepID=UPI002ED37268
MVYTDVCQTGQPIELFHVFVKEGSESEAMSYCAKPFLGVFTYIHTSSSAECGLNWGDSLLDVCNNNRTNMVFDYSLCNTRVAFSAGGHVGCVATLNNGSTYYQSVINFDTTLTVSPRAYRFTCFVIEFDGENVTASEKGENCDSGQTATKLQKRAAHIETPSSPEDSDNTAAIVAGVVVTVLVIAIIIGAVLGYRYFKKKQEEKLFTKRKINPLITVGTVGSLKKMPEPLVNTNHNSSKTKDKNLSNKNNGSTDNSLNNNNSSTSSDDISSNTDNKKMDDNKAVPQPEILVTIDSELQDVDADKESKEQKVPEIDETNGDKVKKDKADKVDKTEHKEEKNIPNGTVTVFDLTENEANVLKTNQPNGVISKEDMKNKPDKEMGENSESVKPEKRVTFPDQPPEGLGKREKTILPSDEAKRAPNEEVSNFGKDKTGMNSRMPSRGGVKPTESSGSLDVLFGKNGVLKPEPQDPHSTLGPRDTTLTDIII